MNRRRFIEIAIGGLATLGGSLTIYTSIARRATYQQVASKTYPEKRSQTRLADLIETRVAALNPQTPGRWHL